MAKSKKENKDKGFSFNPDKDREDKENAFRPDGKNEEPLFKWSSPNGFSNSKNLFWYLVLIIVTLGISALVYFSTKDKITTAVIIVSGILIGIYASKKPHVVNYQLTPTGFTINGRYYNFGSYRSFSVVQHGDSSSIVLTPLKRFMPYMYIYFSGDMSEKIEAVLISILPKETSRQDSIDNLLRKIGF
jgi:hypothetical protein